MGKPARKQGLKERTANARPSAGPALGEGVHPLQRMATVHEEIAWRRLVKLLLDAMEHPEIAQSTHALHFVQAIAFHLAPRGRIGMTADESLREFMSTYQKVIARASMPESQRRLAEARQWVRERWAEEARAYDNNKSAFARDYSRRLVHERALNVGERTIRERWLRD